MIFFDTLYNELMSFLGIGRLIGICKAGDYTVLLTWDGVTSLISPVLPFLLLIEIGRAVLYKRFKIEDYKMTFLIFVVNRFASRFISIAAVVFCIGLLEQYALVKTSFTWYWFIYGYVIWEFAHFIYHYLGHKVRLFWCLHSTHHAPSCMNLSVNQAHFFLEAPYAEVIRTSICMLMGVSPLMLSVIMFIDGTWGTFIHVGENLIKDGRLGFLNSLILTPSHHRVHHAKNPLYMDTNFCNLLNIWDKIFGTFQNEKKEIQIEFGITREMRPNSFLDVYFGEFYYLVKDIYKAPGLWNKFLYIFMPPGWSHTGEHKTANVVRRAYLQQIAQLNQSRKNEKSLRPSPSHELNL